MQAYLVISQGSRWTDIFRLQPGVTVVIGRSSDNQIVIRDDRASRRHAEIALREGAWTVRDMGSRNGTQVNGRILADDHPLADGDTIVVAGCRMSFVVNLATALPPAVLSNDSESLQVSSAQTVELGKEPPTIIQRRSSTRWSQLPKTTANGPVKGGDGAGLGIDSDATFLVRLVFQLVTIPGTGELAQYALDRLLQRIGIEAGGVVLIDPSHNDEQTTDSNERPHESEKDSAKHKEHSLTVLAATQAAGQAYHRVSDFLLATVLRDGQAVLARNVQSDTQLSLARESGQKQTSSIICAPLKEGNRVVGLLHVYTSLHERMLTDSDLELTVAVADHLAIILNQLRQREQLSQSLASSQRKIDLLVQELEQDCEMVGNSTAIEKVRHAIQRCAPTSATVLIRGESGVGKELVARAVHQRSSRRDGPLVCLNCAALAPTLLESELFGHEKGAFTGATERKIGKFEAAHGGTLLLDEIGEMSPELQAKFLRVLEGQPFERLGGNKPIQTDVRVIAATNRDLEQAVREKSFRSDLYFRLRVIEIDVPPLRERPSDIAPLAEHFLQKFRKHSARRINGFTPEALEYLSRYTWPGNVRELRNVIERAVVLGSGSTIDLEDVSLGPLMPINLSPATVSTNETNALPSAYRPISLEQLEKEHILATLAALNGNKSRAAVVLGVERSTLDRKLKRYES